MIDRHRIGELLEQQASVTDGAKERFEARGIDYEDVLAGVIQHGLSAEDATLLLTGIDIGYLVALDVLNRAEVGGRG